LRPSKRVRKRAESIHGKVYCNNQPGDVVGMMWMRKKLVLHTSHPTMSVNLRVEVDELDSSTNFTISSCPIYYYTINFLLSGTSLSIYNSFCFNQMVYLVLLFKCPAFSIPDLNLEIYRYPIREVCLFSKVKTHRLPIIWYALAQPLSTSF
jgi:hypothetical protein